MAEIVQRRVLQSLRELASRLAESEYGILHSALHPGLRRTDSIPVPRLRGVDLCGLSAPCQERIMVLQHASDPAVVRPLFAFVTT